MRFNLTQKEVQLLNGQNILVDLTKDYTPEEALELLDSVRAVEAMYAQDYGNERERMYFQYGNLADKMQQQIPDD